MGAPVAFSGLRAPAASAPLPPQPVFAGVSALAGVLLDEPVMRVFALGAGCALAVILSACPDREISRLDPSQARAETKDIPVTLNRNVDILFVVDDSGSMKEEQDSLQTNFPRFIDRLSTLQGGLPSVHIGVVSTDVGTGTDAIGSCNAKGDDGHMLSNNCSGLNGGASYIIDTDAAGGGRTQNYSGNMPQLFGCMAHLGTGGCGAEQPLESMRLALDPVRNTNPGFIRTDAFLAVVIISDEDDCSTRDRSIWTKGVNNPLYQCTSLGIQCDQPDLSAAGPKTNCQPRQQSPALFDVSEYVKFLQQLKGDKQLIVASITGDPTPVSVSIASNGDAELDASCKSAFGLATPAVRTSVFTGSFSRATHVRICDADISSALDEIAKNIVLAIGDPCIEGALADVDPKTPGLQADCVVTDVVHPDAPNETETILPACDASHSVKPCWTLESDAQQCAAWPSKLKLTVDRGNTSVPSDTHVRAQCVTQ
jgi:hypothetical protein